MQLIKGFVTISDFINNTPGVNALLGELSTWSTTYSKEKGEYQDQSIPGYKLITFSSVNLDDSTQIPVSQDQVHEVLDVIRECVNYATSHIRPYDTLDFKSTLLTTFYNKIANVEIGNFSDNGYLALPEWISWTSLEYSNNSIKIWLSDQAFANQYDDYEVIVVPPIEPIDNFFNFYNVVLNQLNQNDITALLSRVESIKNSHPETYLRILKFDFINPNNPDQSITTNWACIVYGKAGDNIDILKDAIKNYILNNSTHSEAEWRVIFPDVFKRTEFVILPRWDLISIPNLNTISALYSSILDPIESVNFAMQHASFYQESWTEDNVNILPFDYKAISLLCINGPDNGLSVNDIKKVFPDYIPVASTTLDFNRMSIHTRDWIILLERLLIAAESANDYSVIPVDLRKTYRNNKLFITAVYDNINYLVAAKSNDFYQG